MAPLTRLNVRRLLNTIKPAIDEALKTNLFDVQGSGVTSEANFEQWRSWYGARMEWMAFHALSNLYDQYEYLRRIGNISEFDIVSTSLTDFDVSFKPLVMLPHIVLRRKINNIDFSEIS